MPTESSRAGPEMVGARRLELPTSAPPVQRATRLRYAPTYFEMRILTLSQSAYLPIFSTFHLKALPAASVIALVGGIQLEGLLNCHDGYR